MKTFENIFGNIPEDEVYASIREESLWRNKIKSTAAETAIVRPDMNDTT